MSVLGFILFLIVGFVAGLIARAIVPGKQRIGLLMTTLLGIAGSLVGGLFVALLSRDTGFSPVGLLGSILGAIVLLWGYVAMSRRGRLTRS